MPANKSQPNNNESKTDRSEEILALEQKWLAKKGQAHVGAPVGTPADTINENENQFQSRNNIFWSVLPSTYLTFSNI